MTKELSFYLIYYLIYLLFNVSLTLYYINDIIFCLSQVLTEGLIIHDTTIWVWAIFFVMFVVTLWLTLPYFLFLVILWLKSSLFFSEWLFLKINLIVFTFLFLFCIYIYINDLFFAGFVFSNSNNIIFEFQPELQNYLTFINGLFNDLFLSLFLFQLFIILFLTAKNLYQIKLNLFFCIYLLESCVYFYWFGSDGFWSDVLLITILIGIYYQINYLYLFLKNLKKIKNLKN